MAVAQGVSPQALSFAPAFRLQHDRRFAMRKIHGSTMSILLATLITCGLPAPSLRATTPTETRQKLSTDLIRKARGSSSNDRVRLIVQFKPTSPAGITEVITKLAAKVVRRLDALNMRALELPLNAVDALAANDQVRFISPDRPVANLGHLEATTGTANVRVQTTTLLGLITTTTVYDGSGVGVALVDSGIDSAHVSFRNQLGLSRVAVSRDFTSENRTDDPFGHGTHVASIAAGNDQIANGAYTGMAPNAKLINLRVLDSQGTGSTSNLLAALDWVLVNHDQYNIRVVNMSIGTPAVDSYRDDPLCQAVRRLTDAGIVVVAAAGNDGKDQNGGKMYGRIHSPGNEPSAITVGASNSFGTDARGDDTLTTYSQRGPTRSFSIDGDGTKHYDNLIKPDIVAPGNKIVGSAAAGNYLLATHPELDANVSNDDKRRMMYLSGSSMATPIAAGAAAVMLQANPNLTPSLVKAILMFTAQPLAGANTFEQGAGEINIDGAVRIAKIIRTDLSGSTSLGAPLLTGPAPAKQTSVAGQIIHWSEGIVCNHTFAVSDDLITKYQKVYGTGFSL